MKVKIYTKLILHIANMFAPMAYNDTNTCTLVHKLTMHITTCTLSPSSDIVNTLSYRRDTYHLSSKALKYKTYMYQLHAVLLVLYQSFSQCAFDLSLQSLSHRFLPVQLPSPLFLLSFLLLFSLLPFLAVFLSQKREIFRTCEN